MKKAMSLWLLLCLGMAGYARRPLTNTTPTRNDTVVAHGACRFILGR